MISMHRQAKRIARAIVETAMGGELAQTSTTVRGGGEMTPSASELARRAAAEGCVLLVNDGTLPLAASDEVAVFGRCQFDWFYMGYGSGGDVHPPYTKSLVDGLDEAGVRYNRVLAETYRAWCSSDAHAAEPGFWAHWPTHHPEMPVSRSLVQAAAHTARTAVVVIGRSAGEGMDLPLAQGGYYLTNAEHALLGAVCAAFEHTVVVLNTSNVIDLAWTRAYAPRLSAVLCAWQGGMEAGCAVAEVLYGRVNPSGRLACTIAKTYDAYPSSMTFGNRRQVSYTEGVFVGYRHFGTRAPDDVLFPFGHGLSYTTFATELEGVELVEESGSHGRACATVVVSNTGPVAGREVVRMWCVEPRGNVSKPCYVLAAFAKTAVLEPGQSQRLELTCDLKTLASYDELRHAFVLERGDYGFVVGDAPGTGGSARFEEGCLAEGSSARSLVLEDELVVETCVPLCATSEELRARIAAGLREQERVEASRERDELDGLVAELSDDELVALACGDGRMNSPLGTPGNAGVFGGVTCGLRARGVRPIVCADGPSGARLQRHATLLPSATALASTWDPELVRALYALVGGEVRAAGVDVLLAPGMNIQRNPLCGRNFEYFSEDPLVTGRMAAAVVRGLAEAGVLACPKHFACNNQELRRNTCDSRVSERALHEIYLRGFELCVREAAPELVMTSYNKVNGVWAHYHYDLVTTILRGEWGFDGVVITDWWMRPARSPEFPELRNNAYRIRAGVDVLMPGLPKGVRGLSRSELERTARRVLRLASRRG